MQSGNPSKKIYAQACPRTMVVFCYLPQAEIMVCCDDMFRQTNASCTTKEHFVQPRCTYLIVRIFMVYSTVWSFIRYHIKVQPSFFGSCGYALSMNLNMSMTNHTPLWKRFSTMLKQRKTFQLNVSLPSLNTVILSCARKSILLTITTRTQQTAWTQLPRLLWSLKIKLSMGIWVFAQTLTSKWEWMHGQIHWWKSCWIPEPESL